ncbi:bifunctional 2-polyprenyl-6-hydroxyphenol methylase/3-demethylubiquinol 3-O-methyltransferase UbiG [Paracoccus sp. MKU1]|uniref:class I SAM-dependent methyltransferase n=1 Tax=Paracoccus sp. MKU1 TaxID=1745182 RepID=UPI00071919F6|nr:class I SAM-dependent methyltransferase [Paracoccus sp. MKU1]KRW96558.1 methyltransferase type 12 [Paracoccus sp. MKU1]
MAPRISNRIAAFIDALPLMPGLRVLEIGCGPGVAAREVSRRVGSGFVLAIDRSARAIDSAVAGSRAEIASDRLRFRQVAIEDFELLPDDAPFDIAFAMRVGALDGRHPEIEQRALERLRVALKPAGRLFIDTGHPLREIRLRTR